MLTFEVSVDILKQVTTARLALFRAVKHEPGPITDLTPRLYRGRSAVKREVDVLVGRVGYRRETAVALSRTYEGGPGSGGAFLADRGGFRRCGF